MSDAVVIEAPYRSDDCRLITGAAKESLGRVKKVVSRFKYFLHCDYGMHMLMIY